MCTQIMRSMALGALVAGLSAVDASAEQGSVVVLKSGQALECEKFASARNYSLCFDEDGQVTTVNHAELWKVESRDAASTELTQTSGIDRR